MKTVVFHDRRTGHAFVMDVPPTSPWYELLPPYQEAEITTPDNNATPTTAPTHERADRTG